MFERKIYRSPNAGFYGDVLLCCMPLLAMSYVLYGPRPVILAAISCAMAYLVDRLLAPIHGPDYHNGELSSEAFAVLLTLLMPANVSAYVLAFSVITAVVIKEVFGGAGHYPFNPACVGYVVAAVSWPNEIFQYPAVGRIPITGTGSLVLYESASATLRSGGIPNLTTTQLLVGNYAGPLGTGFILILVSLSLFLLLRRRINLSSLLPYLITCGLVVFLFPRTGNVPLSLPWNYLSARLTSLKFEMLSGATIFGGVFLLGEPVTQPKTTASRVTYGALVGFLATMFRYYGVYETGICFSVLILNALSTRLDIMVEWVVSRITGEETKKSEEEQDAVVYKPQPKAPAPASFSTQMMDTVALDAKMMTPMTQAVSREEVKEQLEAQPVSAETAELPKPLSERRRRQRFADATKTLMLPDLKAVLEKTEKEADSDGE